MKDKILTAKEFLKTSGDKFAHSDGFEEAMIEFTKLHVEAQKKAIKENAVLEYDPFPNGNPIGIDKQSIDDAYPLNNVK